jgi:hypothetical protein
MTQRNIGELGASEGAMVDGGWYGVQYRTSQGGSAHLSPYTKL